MKKIKYNNYLALLGLLLTSSVINAQLFINEILVSPPGDDSPNEYIELRGTPNTTIPAGTYLVQIEGDIEGGSDPGDVESASDGGIIDLGGTVIGSNGFVVLLTSGHLYTGILDPNATVVLDVTDGTLEDKSHTFLLINTDTPPDSNDDIDSDNDGVPDGSVYANWTILDGIALLDDDNSSGGPEYAYANVVFVDQATLDNGNVFAPPTATIVGTPTEFDYFARVGNSTGSSLSNDATSDWMGANLATTDLSIDNWETSGTDINNYPNAYENHVLNHLGSENPTPFAEVFELYINEILVSPPGDDSPNEYIELRGTPNTTIPAGTYLVQIEGDIEGGSDPGDVESASDGGIIDLGGTVIGSNGFVVLLTTGHPYTGILDPNATVLLDVTDGTLEDKSHTFLLINTDTPPDSNDDIDSDNDGVPEGSVYANWTILDGIALLDDDNSSGGPEYAYANVVFVDQATLDNGNVFAPPTATIVGTPTEFDYFARVGNSTGSSLSNDATSDWMGANLATTDLSIDNWETSGTDINNYPNAYENHILDHLGSENPRPFEIPINLYINELLVSPPGDDSPNEYIELRGEPNTVIPNGTYLVQIEGDTEGGSEPGDVESATDGGIIDLGGITLGNNGFLVLLTTGHPYANILDPAATVVLDATDGTLEDQSHTFLLIYTDTPPDSNDDIDSDNDGVPDGSVYDGWLILDGISIIDDDNGVGGPEYAYSDVVFVDQVTLDNNNLFAPPTAIIVGMPITFDYFARVGNSTGKNLVNNFSSDWMGADLGNTDLSLNNWSTSSTNTNNYPNDFENYILDHLGAPNPIPSSLSPAQGFVYEDNSWRPYDPSGVSTSSDNITIINGNPVLSNDTEANNINILSKGRLSTAHVLSLDGSIYNQGYLVFLSNEFNTGQLNTFNGTSEGRIETQRFIPAGINNRRSFRYLTSTVTTTTSINENWQESATNNFDNPKLGFGTHITGTTVDGTDGFDGTQTGNPSMFLFNNSMQEWNSISSTDNNTFTAGTPYAILIRGDRTTDLTINNPTPTNTTLRAVGSLLTNIVDVSSTLAGGDEEYSFIANPYQCTVNFNSLTFTGDINPNFLFVWNPNASTFGGYETIDISTDPDLAILQPGQSFFTQNLQTVTTPPGLVFEETDKTLSLSEATITVFNQTNIYEIDLELYNENVKVDVFKIRLESGANNTVDEFDAGKLTNITENIASLNNNTLLSVERRDIPQSTDTIPMFINQYQGTSYQFKLNVKNWDDAITIYMVDNYFNTQTILETNSPYAFTIDNSISQSNASDRFSILIDNSTLGTSINQNENAFKVYPNPVNKKYFFIESKHSFSSNLNISIYDLLGNKLIEKKQSFTENILKVNTETLSTGVYLLKIKNGKQVFNTKLILK